MLWMRDEFMRIINYNTIYSSSFPRHGVAIPLQLLYYWRSSQVHSITTYITMYLLNYLVTTKSQMHLFWKLYVILDYNFVIVLSS